MRTTLTIILITTINYSFSQTFDTVAYDVGKEGGFKRIRELNTKGELRKVWTTDWTTDGLIKKGYYQFNTNNERVTSIDSVFDKHDNVIRIERKIGDTIEGDNQEFDNSEQLIRRDISLFINNKFLVFQKYKIDGEWNYRTIVDGNPPDYIPINKERFEEAVKIYNDRLLIDKINK